MLWICQETTCSDAHKHQQVREHVLEGPRDNNDIQEREA